MKGLLCSSWLAFALVIAFCCQPLESQAQSRHGSRSQVDSSHSRHKTDRVDLGDFECVYLERADSDKKWVLYLSNANITSFEDRIMIWGGFKRGNKNRHGGYAELLWLDKEILKPLDVNSIPNTADARDWKREPLASLPHATRVKDSDRIIQFRQDAILLHADGPAPGRIDPDLKIEKLTDMEMRAFLNTPGKPRLRKHVAREFASPGIRNLWFEERPPVGSVRILVSILDEETMAASKPTEFELDGLDRQTLMCVQVAEDQATFVDTMGLGFEGRIVAANLKTGEHRILYHESSNGAEPNPQFVGGSIYFSSIETFKVVNLRTGDLEREISLPEPWYFGFDFTVRDDGTIFADVRRLRNDDDPVELIAFGEVSAFVMIESGSVDARFSEPLPYPLSRSGSSPFQDMTSDHEYFYFVGAVPSPLLNYSRRQKHTGNHALYRLPVHKFKRP